MYEAAASCKDIARTPVTNWEPRDVYGMKVQLVCNVTRLRYAVTLRGYDTRLFVQLVTPYRITTLQHYVVTVRGNVTSVDPALTILHLGWYPFLKSLIPLYKSLMFLILLLVSSSSILALKYVFFCS
jgi:hypothetical protein